MRAIENFTPNPASIGLRTRRKRADGTIKQYECECCHCYRKINSRGSCQGQNAYTAGAINDLVLAEVRAILSKVKTKLSDELLARASQAHVDINEVAFKQAEKDFFEATSRSPRWKIRQ